MAKVKIELDLDWIEEGGDLDSLIKEEVVQNLQRRFIANVESRTEEMLREQLKNVAERVTDDFLVGVLSEKIENFQIPYKSDDWRSDVQMLTISEFVGKRYERFLTQKTLDKDGNKPRYESDAKLSIHEYFINRYLEKEIVSKVDSLIKKARQDAEETVIKTLESNLKAQLSADIINRLNIPQMLKSLQEKAVQLEGAGVDG